MEESYEVLVADDSILNTKLYMVNLKRELAGWKIHIANSPEEAITIFSTNNISVVILDMFFGIGKLTGIEIYKEFIKIKKNFKCIAVSELSSAYGFNSGRIGIDEFLSKPVKSEDLVSAVKFQIKSLRNELKGTAFCIMPFNEDLYDTYLFGIKQTLNNLNYECFRIDEKVFNSSIIEQIKLSIITSDLLIADLTNANANVYYEVGIAHALNKEVILLSSTAEELKFDLKHMRTIIYNGKISQLQQKLSKEIKAL